MWGQSEISLSLSYNAQYTLGLEFHSLQPKKLVCNDCHIIVVIIVIKGQPKELEPSEPASVEQNSLAP